jgi:predicted TIM-barrel fold metal-dependent hydrolase
MNTRRRLPAPIVSMGRAVRRWRARGPRLGSYAPVSTLELPDNTPERACVPAIDFHTHLGRWLADNGTWMQSDVQQMVDLMESVNVSSLVNLDGRWGKELEENLERYDRSHPGRFHTFCQLDWRHLERPDAEERLVASLRSSVASGARGLKIWKDLGMSVEARGRRVLPDDPALSPMWEEAGALGIPVLIHVADPVAFFLPVDHRNERLEELLRFRHVSREKGGLDEFHRLIDSVEHVIASHPNTSIVCAHGLYPENLAHVSRLCDQYENFSIDIAWAALQLGRQPRTARSFILRHPDRVLFGSDVFPLRRTTYLTYFRFLETADEGFPYTDGPGQTPGRWPISGLDLSLEVCEQVYRTNAARLLEAPAPRSTGRDRIAVAGAVE